MPVILNIDACSNYEPSETEIIEYAKWLGMDLLEDKQFLWIAREGLKAPLPENWKACESDKGELYYFNLKTGESIWDHPMDDYFKMLFMDEKKNLTSRSISRGSNREHDQVQQKTSSRSKRRVVEILREVGQKQNIESECSSNARELNCFNFKKAITPQIEMNFNVSPNKTEPISLPEAQKYQNTKSCNSPNGRFTNSQEKNSPLARAISIVDINSQKKAEKIQKKSSTNKILSGSVRTTSNEFIKEKDNHNDDSPDVGMKNRHNLAPLNTIDPKKEKERPQSDNERKPQDLKGFFEDENQKSLPIYKPKSDAALNVDLSKMESETIRTQDHLEKELSAQKSIGLNETRELTIEQLNLEKKKADDEKTNNLEVFTSELSSEREFRRRTYVQELNEFQTLVSSELKDCVSTLLNEYEEAYTLFHKKIIESENDFTSRIAKQEADTERALNFELMRLKLNNERLIREETERICKKMQETREQHHHDMSALHEYNYAELKEILQDNFRCVNEKRDLEKASMPVVKNSSCKVSYLASDTLNKELGEGSELQLKTTKSELADRQEILTEPQKPSVDNIVRKSNDTSSQEAQSNDFNRRGECHSMHGISSVDENDQCTTSHETNSYGLLQQRKNCDLKAIITATLKEVIAESPLVSSYQSVNNRKYPSIDPSRLIQSTPSIINDVQAPHIKNFIFPASFQDQHKLIGAESRRVREGWMFVTNQRRNLEERRQQLKYTRHQWKQDVLDAKKDGVKSSSRRGQLLFKVRMALEEQAQGLKHDECILHDSELWLKSKEQRLKTLEGQLKEQESYQILNENSLMNCSIDTAGLVADFFEPQHNSPSEPLRLSQRSHLGNINMFERGDISPILSKYLKQIEKHLGKVTSIVKMQRPHENISTPFLDSRKCITPTYSVSQDSKKCYSNFNIHSKEANLKQIIHSDPL
ncbi:unnamed protein product [Phytomonas sp. Hart1]|nr:unnamed protein product [Phytomonas sp. Hart1]|eukprot:CCW71345.1 unnamed protein product [Phytomonas sp. isolate Hart1]